MSMMMNNYNSLKTFSTIFVFIINRRTFTHHFPHSNSLISHFQSSPQPITILDDCCRVYSHLIDTSLISPFHRQLFFPISSTELFSYFIDKMFFPISSKYSFSRFIDKSANKRYPNNNETTSVREEN